MKNRGSWKPGSCMKSLRVKYSIEVLEPYLHLCCRSWETSVRVRQALRDKSFPRDQQFREQFITCKIYGGDRSAKAGLAEKRD